MAALLAINRLCAPGSELAVEQRWYPSTALDDLLQIEDGKINDTRLYRCLDRILPHKTKLERHLKNRYGELFGAEFDVLLYDLTSTYVEGAAEKNPMVRRGYSRDHRPDCEQLVIALIVNNEGFPFSYETFDGNRTDVSTMETILRMVERKYGKARRIWVFDRGIVSEENLDDHERKVYGLWRSIADISGGLPSVVRELKISETMRPSVHEGINPGGLWEPATGRVIIHRRELRSIEAFAGTLLHELTHAHSGSSDVTREFELALTEMVGRITAAALQRGRA